MRLLGATRHAGAESGFAPASGKASASLNFRIVTPPVMRVLENSHPDRVAFDEGGQRLPTVHRTRRALHTGVGAPVPSHRWRRHFGLAGAGRSDINVRLKPIRFTPKPGS